MRFSFLKHKREDHSKSVNSPTHRDEMRIVMREDEAGQNTGKTSSDIHSKFCHE